MSSSQISFVLPSSAFQLPGLSKAICSSQNVVAMCWQDIEGSWAGPQSTHGEADGGDVTEDSEKQDVMPGDGERGQHGAL